MGRRLRRPHRRRRRALLLAVPPANPLPQGASGAKAIAQLLLDPAYQVE
ncbi:Uncharacterised protein [Chromobacterium violaceum]|uniref:Uncharacterized protein n=1 Tax=Chromobacterium violaceum TaxID=536 RepID=A0A3S4JZA0_CHRVL|nr:Uncharacterised protein [Chromobacterium violaceum]